MSSNELFHQIMSLELVLDAFQNLPFSLNADASIQKQGFQRDMRWRSEVMRKSRKSWSNKLQSCKVPHEEIRRQLREYPKCSGRQLRCWEEEFRCKSIPRVLKQQLWRAWKLEETFSWDVVGRIDTRILTQGDSIIRGHHFCTQEANVIS